MGEGDDLRSAETAPARTLAPVDLQTRFDQFPATIKGAFVLRGADGNPHAVDLIQCTVDRIPTGPTRPVPVGQARVDVAPGRDLFVPFEMPIGDLDPGWYALRSTVRVDAGATWSFSSRGFAIPWPTGEVRKGTVRVDRTVKAGSRPYQVESVELRADAAVLTWRPAAGPGGTTAPERGGGDPVLGVLLVDGLELELIPEEARPLGSRPAPTGAGRAVFYPVSRRAASISVLMRTPSGAESKPIELPLR